MADNIVVNITENADLVTINITENVGGGGSSDWGDIGGTLSNQTDLQNALDLKANVSAIPDQLSDLSDDSTHRLVTDSEKNTWNNKEPAISTGTTAQYFRGDKTFQTLDKSAVGLGNVPNVDATNPANISQDSTHRFVTDAEKTTWNNKLDGISLSIQTIDFLDEQNQVELIVADATITANTIINVRHESEDLALQGVTFYVVKNIGIGYSIFGVAPNGASGQYQIQIEKVEGE